MKFGWLTMINAALACIANLILPLLGPACVTIVGGVGQVMTGLRDEKPGPKCGKAIEADQCTDD